MSAHENARILVVEDDKELTFVLRAHLTAAGFEVEEASDAETALERVVDFRRRSLPHNCHTTKNLRDDYA